MGELEEAFQCSSPRVEGPCPRFNVRDVFVDVLGIYFDTAPFPK
jgi:hypothetical protein